MSDLDRRLDIERNTAYYLGAIGSTLGILGGALALVGIVSVKWPQVRTHVPGWTFGLASFAVLSLVIAGWPALDRLVNLRPRLGGGVISALALGYLALGGYAVLHTTWDLAGWIAISGSVALLLAADYAMDAGGTEPLTWRSLRTQRVIGVEARLGYATNLLIELALVGGLVATLVHAAGGSAVAVSLLALIGVVRGAAYLVGRLRR